MSVHPFSKINRDLNDIFLVREVEWICILNIASKNYTRILRIKKYFDNSTEPSQGLIAILPHAKEADDSYSFVMVCGVDGKKLAKYSIDKRVVEFLANQPIQQQK